MRYSVLGSRASVQSDLIPCGGFRGLGRRLRLMRLLITVSGRHSSYLGMMSIGATLHRGEIQCPIIVKLEAYL